MSQLVRLEGKHTTQNAHCALLQKVDLIQELIHLSWVDQAVLSPMQHNLQFEISITCQHVLSSRFKVDPPDPLSMPGQYHRSTQGVRSQILWPSRSRLKTSKRVSCCAFSRKRWNQGISYLPNYSLSSGIGCATGKGCRWAGIWKNRWELPLSRTWLPVVIFFLLNQSVNFHLFLVWAPSYLKRSCCIFVESLLTV